MIGVGALAGRRECRGCGSNRMIWSGSRDKAPKGRSRG